MTNSRTAEIHTTTHYTGYLYSTLQKYARNLISARFNDVSGCTLCLEIFLTALLGALVTRGAIFPVVKKCFSLEKRLRRVVILSFCEDGKEVKVLTASIAKGGLFEYTLRATYFPQSQFDACFKKSFITFSLRGLSNSSTDVSRSRRNSVMYELSRAVRLE